MEPEILPPINEPEVEVRDDTESDDTVAPVKYEITSFGADYDAEGLVKRLQRDDIFIPEFQRDYVWGQKEASRFIESLLLGLPVPGIFLARDFGSRRLIVIDGQQRLKTLRFFFEGYFAPAPDSQTKRVFRLTGVQPQFEGLTYETLSDADRIILNDSIIHATVIKQESPEGDQSSVYHIFERLNTAGRKLTAQQIRIAIFPGPFIDLIRELNGVQEWRDIFGRRSRTLKDEELILRFLALYHDLKSYTSPMNEFLNDFTKSAKGASNDSLDQYRRLFIRTIQSVHNALGSRAFRLERALNAAVFDSVMVGIAKTQEAKGDLEPASLVSAYDLLLKDIRYIELVSKATANEKNLQERMELSLVRFAAL